MADTAIDVDVSVGTETASEDLRDIGESLIEAADSLSEDDDEEKPLSLVEQFKDETGFYEDQSKFVEEGNRVKVTSNGEGICFSSYEINTLRQSPWEILAISDGYIYCERDKSQGPLTDSQREALEVRVAEWSKAPTTAELKGAANEIEEILQE